MKLVSVVVGVGREHRRNYAGSLDTPEQIVVNQCAMGDLWASVRSWKQLLCPLDRCEDHIDGDIPIRVAINLNSTPMHSLDPNVEVVLGLYDFALIWWIDFRIRLFQLQCVLRLRVLYR